MKYQENKYIFYFWGSGHIFSSCKTTPKAVIIGVYKNKLFHIKWDPESKKYDLKLRQGCLGRVA